MSKLRRIRTNLHFWCGIVLFGAAFVVGPYDFAFAQETINSSEETPPSSPSSSEEGSSLNPDNELVSSEIEENRIPALPSTSPKLSSFAPSPQNDKQIDTSHSGDTTTTLESVASSKTNALHPEEHNPTLNSQEETEQAPSHSEMAHGSGAIPNQADESVTDSQVVNAEAPPSSMGQQDADARVEARNNRNVTSPMMKVNEIPQAPTLIEHVKWPGSSLPQRQFMRQLPANQVAAGEFHHRYAPLFHPDWAPDNNGIRSSYGEVPIVLNSPVERNLRYFQDGIPERFQGYLDRFEKYKPVVQQIFEEFGLPVELSYLSLVESGFNPKAYSRARASGPWQFMKATGRLYGLRVNWHIDERRDPIKSTVAAAHHLRDLYDRFGSWPLALAAYNAGSGKISRAIRKSRTRDYWKIRQSWRYIRRETREYVPRFIAATMIAMNPADYGFTITPTDPYAYNEVSIKKRVHLRSIAKATGISLEELKILNPELRRSIIPTHPEGYHLKVPLGTGVLVEKHHDQLELWKQPPPPPTQWYRVRRGDSLSVVAKRFGMSVRTLKNLNNRSGNLIRVGDRLRVRAADPPVNLNATWYTVRYGDNLSEIAHKFRTSARKLRRLNNISGNLIHVGDRLKVRETPQPSGETKWYRVRRGDSLWSIARQFSVSVTDLKILNNLTSSVIRAGHMLLVSQ